MAVKVKQVGHGVPHATSQTRHYQTEAVALGKRQVSRDCAGHPKGGLSDDCSTDQVPKTDASGGATPPPETGSAALPVKSILSTHETTDPAGGSKQCAQPWCNLAVTEHRRSADPSQGQHQTQELPTILVAIYQ